MLLKQLVYTIVYYIPMALRYASFGGSPSASFKRPLALCFLSEDWNAATLVSTSALIFLATAVLCMTGERMPSICARGKFNPLEPQRNACEAEICRFAAILSLGRTSTISTMFVIIES